MSGCYTRDEIAALLGAPSSPASDTAVRSFLSRARIRSVTHYDAAAVDEAIATQRPGRGARTDIIRRKTMATLTLISALSGDAVPGVELAECDGKPWITDLTENAEVKAFFAANNYGPESPDELMYVMEGDSDAEIPTGFPTLTITL